MRAVNPVLQRELLERWRGRRATTALTVYLVVLAGALYGLYLIGLTLTRDGFASGDVTLAGPALGRFLLESLVFLTLVLVLFVVPAYAAAQLAGERERRTLPLLQATLLRPWEIVAGKLAAATAWVALLVVAVAPLAAATLFLGGVTVVDVLRGVGSILVTMVGIGGLALGISAVTRRTTTAVVLTYAAVLTLVAGTAIAAVASVILSRSSGPTVTEVRPPAVLYANPFYGLADAVNATNPAAAVEILPSPLSVISMALPDSSVFAPDDGQMVVEDGIGPAPVVDQPSSGHPTWLIVGGVYVLLGATGFTLATWRLRDAAVRPSRRATRRAPRGDHQEARP